jgi:hypothetical protein
MAINPNIASSFKLVDPYSPAAREQKHAWQQMAGRPHIPVFRAMLTTVALQRIQVACE